VAFTDAVMDAGAVTGELPAVKADDPLAATFTEAGAPSTVAIISAAVWV
jgi:hypothetical protein